MSLNFLRMIKQTFHVTFIFFTVVSLVNCSDIPKREKFPGAQGRTTDQDSAETSKAVLGGFDPLNNRLPGMGGVGSDGAKMNWKAPVAESIRGVIKLGPMVLLKEGMMLFVSARKGEGGPPLAVIRDQYVEFPYKFVMSKSNAMMEGTDFSGDVALTVRLKQDADPLSKKKGDYFATINTKVGTENLEIVLSEEILENSAPPSGN